MLIWVLDVIDPFPDLKNIFPLLYSIPLLFYSTLWEISATLYYYSFVELFAFAIRCFISRISFMFSECPFL